MSDEKSAQERDDVRLETAIQTAKDILWRFDEASEGTRSIYDLLGFLMQDLLREGFCPACLNEVITAAYTETGADILEHKEGEGSVFH